MQGSFVDYVPVRLHWKGWESSTERLRRQGWEIWASESLSCLDFAKHIRLAARSPDGKLVVSGILIVSHEQLVYGMQFGGHRGDEIIHTLTQHGVEMKEYTLTDRVVQYALSPHDLDSWQKLEPVSALAAAPVYGGESIDFKTFRIFQTEAEKAQPIYLPTIDECFDRILQLQFPDRVKPEELAADAKPIVQAKIYTLQQAA